MLCTKRITKFIVSYIVFCFDSVKRFYMSMRGKEQPATCVILYYHSVGMSEREHFAKQLDEILSIAKPIWADRPDMMAEGYHHIAVTFDDGYRSFLENALPELMKRSIPVHMFIPAACMGSHPSWPLSDESEYMRETVMSVEEAKGLNADIIAVGSHCMTHRDLKSMNEEEMQTEIIQSKRILESILGIKINTISFPEGSFDTRHVECAKLAGYLRVYSIQPTVAFSSVDEYVTGRVRVDPSDSMLEFRLKALGCYRWLALVSEILGSSARSC